MATATTLTNDILNLGGQFDNVVIVDNFQSKRGGASLDVTGFTPARIYAGHVIIKETATGVYKPMPVTGDSHFDDGTGAYGTLPAGHEYIGIQIQSVPTNRAMVGVLLRGTVNPSDAVNPYPLGPILADLQAAVTARIDFRADRQ